MILVINCIGFCSLVHCEVVFFEKKTLLHAFTKNNTVLFSFAIYVTQHKGNNDNKHSEIVRTELLAVCSQTIVHESTPELLLFQIQYANLKQD